MLEPVMLYNLRLWRAMEQKLIFPMLRKEKSAFFVYFAINHQKITKIYSLDKREKNGCIVLI